jgi:hypothetical protein
LGACDSDFYSPCDSYILASGSNDV